MKGRCIRKHPGLSVIHGSADPCRWHRWWASDQHHRHIADDHHVLAEAPFELGAPVTPIGQVDLLHHDLEYDNVIAAPLSSLMPQTLGRGLKIGGHTIELAGEIFLYTIELFTSKRLP